MVAPEAEKESPEEENSAPIQIIAAEDDYYDGNNYCWILAICFKFTTLF